MENQMKELIAKGVKLDYKEIYTDDAVDGITKTKHLNIVAESLDTLEVTSALAKLCDVAIDMLGEINESN